MISSPPPSHSSPSMGASQSQASQIPISITICGDGGCGKSSITLRLVRCAWTEDYDPTIEDSYSVTRRVDGTSYHLALTDTAGQEEYRAMWAGTSVANADAFLFVYDITNRASLDALNYFNDLVSLEAEHRADNAVRARDAGLLSPAAARDLSSIGSVGGAKTVPPVKLVAGNKVDLRHLREVPAAVGLEWARTRGCGFMETSARLEVNVEETFALIVRRVVEARQRAAMDMAAADDYRRGATQPLSPLPPSESEKPYVRHRGSSTNAFRMRWADLRQTLRRWFSCFE